MIVPPLFKILDSERACVKLLQKVRWSNGIHCSNCQSHKVIRWGKYKKVYQRYRCKACFRTFNDKTGTLFAYRHLSLQRQSMGKGGQWKVSFQVLRECFGEVLQAKRFDRMVKEIEMKVWVYNLMLGLSGATAQCLLGELTIGRKKDIVMVSLKAKLKNYSTKHKIVKFLTMPIQTEVRSMVCLWLHHLRAKAHSMRRKF